MDDDTMEWWEEKYAEFLDEIYPDGVNVAGIQYNVVRVLREIDPTAFATGANDYADAEEWDTNQDADAHGNPDHDSDECSECNPIGFEDEGGGV